MKTIHHHRVRRSMVFGSFHGCIRRFSSVVPSSSIRLSKWMSENLQVSRKEAERCIRAGTVRIAGAPVPSPAALVSLEQLTSLTVHGKKVNALPPGKAKSSSSSSDAVTVWLIHKRRGELVTHTDPRDRPVVQPPIPNAIFVGRLDMNTEGLLLCTNSGTYARELELPMNQYHRMYRVRVHGKMDDQKLRALQRGLRVDDQTRYSGMKVVAETKKTSNATNQWLQITCTEGQNRQIRNALGHLGRTYILLAIHHRAHEHHLSSNTTLDLVNVYIYMYLFIFQ
jgi:23S rRNA pseudouridine2605 synthase